MHDALSRAKHEANTRLVRSVALISTLVVAATLLGLALSRAQAVRITTPVEELTKAAEALARGRHSIRVQLDSGDELELLGSSFNRMAEELVASYKQLQELNHTLEQKVVERTAELALKNRDMKLVLDNVDQGFITLSREGVICGEPSRVVGRWFGNGHADVPFAAYVGGVAAEFASGFEFGWTQVVDDLLPLELALDQLPTRMQSEHRTWTLRYLPFDQDGRFEGVLVVVDDVTERLAREREEAAQSELMRAFGKLIADRSGFMDFLSEASGMVEEIRAKAERPAEAIALKRTLHTLKGNAAVMGLSVVASICHTLEDQLAERGAMSEGTLDELSSRWEAITEHVQRFTGDSTQSFVELSESEYTDLVASLASDPHQGELLRRVLTFRLEPAERALGRLGQQAQAIARRLGKGEVEVEVRATGVRLNRQIWSPFFADMIHVVRNAMDHGLELAEQRKRAGKTPAGKLLLRAETSESELVFEVTDDGRGIDWALIAEKAKRGGLPHLTQADLTAALCADGISTLDEVSDLSGRGIGMAAVKSRIQALHGSLEVRSTKGAGTTWLIRFPMFAPRATGTAA
jgi:two-component system chemotaxis sensor kinase CheA